MRHADYNSRMIDEHPMAFGLLMLAIALGLLFFFYKMLMAAISRPGPLTTAQAVPADIAKLESAIGGQLPAPLRNAYLDGSILRLRLPATLWRLQTHDSQAESAEDCVAEFYAANAASNARALDSSELPADAFVFARDDFGNLYYLRGSKNGVYYWDHDADSDGTMIYATFNDFWAELLQRSSAA
jgi:hypothetical protein